MKNLKLLLPLCGILAAASFLAACGDDEGSPGNEPETITTVRLTFSATGAAPLTFTSKDLDGDGGNPPATDTVKLKQSTAYQLAIGFLDESDAGSPQDITAEVMAEDTLHLVCFTATDLVNPPAITDADANGLPLGLTSALIAGSSGPGTLRVVLRHGVNKAAVTPCATGKTDADATFQVVIE